MSNTCSVCRHKSRREIETALAGGESLRHIASRLGAGYKAIERHQKNCIPAALAEVRHVNESRHAMNVQDELARCFHRVNLLFDACQEALADPERPGKYTLDAHAQDVSVIYTEHVGGKEQRKRAKLSTLLARLEGMGMTVEAWESRHADPRELILKTAGQLAKQIDILAKMSGSYQEPMQNQTDAREMLQALIEEQMQKHGLPRSEVVSRLVALDPASAKYLM